MVNQRRQSRWVESATTGSTRLHRFVAPPTAEPLGWINKSEVAESIQPAPVLQVKSGPTSQLSPAGSQESVWRSEVHTDAQLRQKSNCETQASVQPTQANIRLEQYIHGLIQIQVGRVAKVSDPVTRLARKTAPDHHLTKAFQRKPLKSGLRH